MGRRAAAVVGRITVSSDTMADSVVGAGVVVQSGEEFEFHQ